MTPQEAFDKAILHLLTQGRRAMRDGDCYYRLSDGDGKVLMCAVGCLIPDELYRPEMESVSAAGLFEKFPELCAVLPDNASRENDGFGILSKLQSLHDHGGNWICERGPSAKFFSRARSIAEHQGLHTDVLDQWEART